jgi:AP-1 complex subunit sigma 1/2
MNSHNDDGKKGACGWHFMVLMSRQGKVRLSEFFSSFKESEKRRILRDIAGDVLPRAPKMCNIIEKGTYKFVYRRYASLYFVAGVPLEMNELLVLEQIHLFVEALDGYFNSGEFSSVQYMFVCYVVMSES